MSNSALLWRALGRLAAALAGVPVRIHTYHGGVAEVLEEIYQTELDRAH